MTTLHILLTVLVTLAPAGAAAEPTGAWQLVDGNTTSTWIMTNEHFSIARYRTDPAEFVSTSGGTWTRSGNNLELSHEYDTATPDLVGTTRTVPVVIGETDMVADGGTWERIDGGTPGALEGAWLMTGRKRDGEISTRRPGVRRTMKILSGTRFQWIAYNVETREFFGTGGGTYTTEGGLYTENIEFFSRDDSRAGMSLEFRYDLIEDGWHHIGKSTAGEPMHEVWERRDALGI